MKHIPLDEFIFERLNFYNPDLLGKILLEHSKACLEEEE